MLPSRTLCVGGISERQDEDTDNNLQVHFPAFTDKGMASVSSFGDASTFASTCQSETQLVDPKRGGVFDSTMNFSTVNFTVTETADFPELPYDLRSRKRSIAIVFTLLLLDASFLPLALFYGLKFGAKLDDTKSIAITTAVFGFFSFLQFGYRIFQLVRPKSTCRPLSSTSPTGMTPWYFFDFYQIQFAVGFAGISVAFAFATMPPMNFALLAIPPSLLIAQCAPQFLFSAVMYKLNTKLPFRLSSTEKGERAPPAVYTIIEDIVAVEGGGGITFRKAIKRRYTESWRFREHIYTMTVFWGSSGMICGGGVLAMVLTLPKYVAYGIGWTLPFFWAGVMAWITIRWTQRVLNKEWEDWCAGRWGSGARIGGGGGARREGGGMENHQQKQSVSSSSTIAVSCA